MGSRVSSPVRHQRVAVAGIDTFYREAGAPGMPVVLLPHGYPCSSYAFRNLLPALGDRWHVLALIYPDSASAQHRSRMISTTPSTRTHTFCGHSSTPSVSSIT
jgi:pimeloyl-ACP methyl ester carboxylesterase